MNLHTYNTQPRWRVPDQTIIPELPKRYSQPALLAVLTSLLISLTLSGCVALTSAGKPAKTSSNGGASGTLAASATSFTFGNVAIGSKSSQALTLTNTGTAAVMISQATISGAGFSTSAGMSSVSIAPGQSQVFPIQFAPQAAGNHSGSIVVASDASDSTLSVSLNGTGMTGLSLTTQPASQSVTAGQTATFGAIATGSGALTYQWKKNGVAIGGATFSTYTTPVTTASDNSTSFTVVVSDSTNTVTSNPATLTVTAAPVAPTITMQPASQTISTGQSATFSVSATGTATLTYQWRKNAAAISGANSSAYTIPATTVSDNGAQFTVTVTNSTGYVTSNVATLTVNVQTSLLKANTTVLNFASVNISSNSSLGVTFTNAGNSNVTISNVSIAGPGFAASGASAGEILTPGQSTTLNVTFTPATAGTGTGSATVASNAANSPTTITLSGIGVQVVSHSATFSWAASSSAVAGYNVYRSAASGGPYTRLNSVPVTMTRYMDSSVLPGNTYFGVITSVDSSNVESKFSNEVSATIPTN